MSTGTLAGLFLGAGLAAGVVLTVAGWRGWSLAGRFASEGPTLKVSRKMQLRIAAAATVGVIVLLVTRWVVAGAGAAALIVVWPYMFGSAGQGRRDLAYLDGLATWTESLRDTIAGAIGLEQAIPATTANAPAVLAEPLERLVARLRVRTPLPEALGHLADDIDDPGADLVIASLILNARTRGPGLRDSLSALTVAAREELEQRQRSEARRGTLRRSARIIVGITVGFAFLLSIFANEWMARYDTPLGQLMLLVVFGIFGLGFIWLRQLAVTQRPERFLVDAGKLRAATAGGGPQ
ncbi:MAG: type II secretion system F family protein [Nocardioidaceae bacterium]